jgi:hypothetical protein
MHPAQLRPARGAGDAHHWASRRRHHVDHAGFHQEAPGADLLCTGVRDLVVQFAGPSIAGILTTGLVSGRAGLRELLSRLLRRRVGARWYAAALLPGIVTTDERLALLLFGLAWGLMVRVYDRSASLPVAMLMHAFLS